MSSVNATPLPQTAFDDSANAVAPNQASRYPMCHEGFDYECTEIAYILCSSPSCEHPMCESCAQQTHSVEVFRHHSLRKGPGVWCMFSHFSKCNQYAQYTCRACPGIQACQTCLQKHHKNRPSHQDQVYAFTDNAMYPHTFRHENQLDKETMAPNGETVAATVEISQRHNEIRQSSECPREDPISPSTEELKDNQASAREFNTIPHSPDEIEHTSKTPLQNSVSLSTVGALQDDQSPHREREQIPSSQPLERSQGAPQRTGSVNKLPESSGQHRNREDENRTQNPSYPYNGAVQKTRSEDISLYRHTGKPISHDSEPSVNTCVEDHPSTGWKTATPEFISNLQRGLGDETKDYLPRLSAIRVRSIDQDQNVILGQSTSRSVNWEDPKSWIQPDTPGGSPKMDRHHQTSPPVFGSSSLVSPTEPHQHVQSVQTAPATQAIPRPISTPSLQAHTPSLPTSVSPPVSSTVVMPKVFGNAAFVPNNHGDKAKALAHARALAQQALESAEASKVLGAKRTKTQKSLTTRTGSKKLKHSDTS